MNDLGTDIAPAKYTRLEGFIFLAAFALTIPAANWLIGNAGIVCLDKGPCLIPVAPGLMAPSGVLMIGLALVLRDLVQRRLGAMFAIAAILTGAFLSAFLAPPSLVLASSAAFYYRSLQILRFIRRCSGDGWSLPSLQAASSG